MTPLHTVGVALPRILYGADIWCGPPKNTHTEVKNQDTSRIINQLTTIQRSRTLAITGGFHTSPTDTLDACTFLLPLSLMVERWSLHAAVRLASSPPEHPLYKPVKHMYSKNAKRHRSPLHLLLGPIDFNPKLIEKISANNSTGRIDVSFHSNAVQAGSNCHSNCCKYLDIVFTAK